MDKQAVLDALKTVKTASGQSNIVDAGHVRNLQIFGDEVVVDVVADRAALHLKKKLEVDILTAIHTHVHPKAKIKVNLTVEAPAETEAQRIRGEAIPGVQHIVAVASGKGGVGKSTVTANLAVALAEMGFSVGVVDADIYGPSMPLMLDAVNEKPGSIEVDGKRMMEPVFTHGVKLMSIGFFAGTDQAVVWRGPMATKALTQMIKDTYWGELDFLLLDLPPGTGDIHLSVVQAVPVSGAVVVSTPQAVALADARKGVGMFRMESIGVPVLGLVENMAFFTPAELPNNKYYLFGQGGVRRLADEVQVPFLGEVPLVQSIREAGDVGRPAVLQTEGPAREAFVRIARETVDSLANRVENLPPTEAVRITTMAGCTPSIRTNN
jgi:ATP-binding protein involved in chromosome partitioning